VSECLTTTTAAAAAAATITNKTKGFDQHKLATEANPY
jgi:hypothetical protein